MKYIFLILFLSNTAVVIGQDTIIPEIERQDSIYSIIKSKKDSLYQANIKKSRINGVYIPKSMEDAFKEIDKLSPPASIEKFKAAPEEEVARKLHFGLGKWIAVNWNFEEGSRIAHIIKEMKVYNTDDMVNFMLRSYHRYLNGVDQEYEARAKVYFDKRAKEFRVKNSKDK